MSKLLDKLKSRSTVKLTSVMSDSNLFGDKKLTKLDLPILNLALSGSVHGGLSSGVTVVAAPSKHFKSNISLFMVSAYLKENKDAICLFYDSEFGSPPAYLTNFDIDTSRVLHTPVTTVEELRTDIVNQLDGIDRGDKVIVFIDSIGNLASKKETVDAMEGSEKADMTRAKTIKSLFRIITPQMTIKDIPCIVINHTIDTISFISQTVMTGGCIVQDTDIQMSDGTLKKIQDIQVGEKVKTLTKDSVVTHVWNPDTLVDGMPECIELTFDDGFTVTTSSNHKFLCSVQDRYEWVEAKDLTSEYDVVTV